MVSVAKSNGETVTDGPWSCTQGGINHSPKEAGGFPVGNQHSTEGHLVPSKHEIDCESARQSCGEEGQQPLDGIRLIIASRCSGVVHFLYSVLMRPHLEYCI